MRFTLALSLVIVTLTVPSQCFIAFSGNACDGAAGQNVPCNGVCEPFGGRHSFIADSPGRSHCVGFFVGGGCSGQMFNFTGQAGQCTNVNTGTDIESFKCFSGTGCF